MLTKREGVIREEGHILQKNAIYKKVGCRRFSTLDKIRIYIFFKTHFKTILFNCL
jgi:hypothetical protein